MSYRVWLVANGLKSAVALPDRQAVVDHIMAQDGYAYQMRPVDGVEQLWRVWYKRPGKDWDPGVHTLYADTEAEALQSLADHIYHFRGWDTCKWSVQSEDFWESLVKSEKRLDEQLGELL